MPYNEKLAGRIRAALDGRVDVEEKKMFGGLAFMVRGSMACGILGDDLMARVPADQFEVALARPHARVMDFTGRPLKGFVVVDATGVGTARALQAWVDEAVAFATSDEQVAKQAAAAKAKAKAKKPKRPRPFPAAKTAAARKR